MTPPSVTYAAGLGSYQPSANDLTLAAAQTLAAQTLYALISSLQLFDLNGHADGNRTAEAQNALLSLQPLLSQSDCDNARVNFVVWKGQINWVSALAQARALIASGF